MAGSGERGGFVAVGRLEEFPDGAAVARTIGARRVVVYRQGDELFALKDLCPHEGEALHRRPPSGGAAVCAGHGWRFDLRTGRCLRGDPEARVAVYPVRVEEGRVLVGIR